jgi:multiple antibiotic resistance protein
MHETVSDFVRVVMLALAALLPLINPPGTAPIFLSLTPGASDLLRTAMAGQIARTSFVLLVMAMLVGSYVLIFFGLSLSVVKIAGGLLVITTAWRLIGAERSPDATIVTASPPSAQELASQSLASQSLASRSFYPLTFPLTIGPGSLSVAVTLGAGIHSNGTPDIGAVLGMVAGIALVACTVYLCYRFASRLLRVLGANGSVVLLRLSAFILLAVGVQIFCDGLVERFAAGSA